MVFVFHFWVRHVSLKLPVDHAVQVGDLTKCWTLSFIHGDKNKTSKLLYG